MTTAVPVVSYRLTWILIQLYMNVVLVSSYYKTLAPVDDSLGYGRVFDGLGGISGGGATSKLLVNYPTKQRNEILDYLFKPNFGASLHILKVEIGGDSQSSDGTEQSHMHNPWDESYVRGYEWWLMVEAKKRNPNIKLYGLPWGFPGWLASTDSETPYSRPEVTADYILKWVQGAKKYYNLKLDYLGIWNEHPYDKIYVEILSSTLNNAGFSNIQLVVADNEFADVSSDCLSDPKFNASTDIIGAHYPGTVSPPEAVKTGKPLWSSEDYSTFNDNIGAGCWARILNQNYVNGLITSTIAWNLIAAYYQHMPFTREALMTADQPWSGHYDVNNPIWITAHTSQFANIGWKYLRHDSGVGKLANGGSYVTLMSPDNRDFTIVVEKMSHNHSGCIRPGLPPYSTSPEKVTFSLKGTMAKVKYLNVWMTKLCFSKNCTDKVFAKFPPVKIRDGQFSINVDVDTIYTFTTLSVGVKGNYGPTPSRKPFPLPYKDNFEGYKIGAEPFNFPPQIGSFEIAQSDSEHNRVTKQTVLQHPIDWCATSLLYPFAAGGMFEWENIYMQLDVQIGLINGTNSAFIAARAQNCGGCWTYKANGIFFWLVPDLRQWKVTGDIAQTQLIKSGTVGVTRGAWVSMALRVKGSSAMGLLNGIVVFNMTLPEKLPKNGFTAFGTGNFGLAYFDNLYIDAVQ